MQLVPIVAPPSTSTPTTSATATTTTPSSGPIEKKKRGRKPKTSLTPSATETTTTTPMSSPSKPPMKMPMPSHVGGPDTIRSPRGAGSPSHSAWRGPPAGSASFQVRPNLKLILIFLRTRQNRFRFQIMVASSPIFSFLRNPEQFWHRTPDLSLSLSLSLKHNGLRH